MVYLTLQHQNFRNIQMNIDIQENSEIEIESTFSFNISYNEDNTACIAEIKQELQHKSKPEELSIVITGKAHFACEGISTDADKKEAHVKAYTLLFPYVQGIIARLTVEAGLPPLMIGMAKLSAENVELASDKR